LSKEQQRTIKNIEKPMEETFCCPFHQVNFIALYWNSFYCLYCGLLLVSSDKLSEDK
jgi:hypothetical protein